MYAVIHKDNGILLVKGCTKCSYFTIKTQH
jgi:hypothetical protein